jgi:hypothetical protein
MIGRFLIKKVFIGKPYCTATIIQPRKIYYNSEYGIYRRKLKYNGKMVTVITKHLK